MHYYCVLSEAYSVVLVVFILIIKLMADPLFLPLWFRYNKMEMCITPNNGNGEDESLKPFPERLYAVPPRIANGLVPGVSVEKYQQDSKEWKKHVSAYKKINKLLDTGRYRNIMDMNAGLGGFAAALHSPKFWVMNVMPTIAEKNTLGVIYERGLIGIYHDWYVQIGWKNDL